MNPSTTNTRTGSMTTGLLRRATQVALAFLALAGVLTSASIPAGAQPDGADSIYWAASDPTHSSDFIPTSATAEELAAIENFMTWVITDIHTYWAEVAATEGLSPTVTYNWVSPDEHGTTNGCTPNNALTEASYCGLSDVISVADLFALGVYAKYGDMAVAEILAHEYAHNLQREFGLVGTAPTVDLELQADCLAGRWSGSADERGMLEAGDVQEAAEFFTWLGDHNFESDSHHGTPEQRMDAFFRGFNGWTCPTTGIR